MARKLEFKSSSNVTGAELGDDGITTVSFKNGTTYRYRNITPAMFDEWEKAGSAGSWFHANVKQKPDKFPQVKDGEEAAVPAAAAAAAGGALANDAPSTDAATLIGGAAPAEAPVVRELRPDDEVFKAKDLVDPAPAVIAKVDIADLDSFEQGLAEGAYGDYIANSDGLNYEGKACPTWDSLPASIQSHWGAAARGTARRLEPKVHEAVARATEALTARVAELEAALRATGAPVPAAAAGVGAQARKDFRPWRRQPQG